MSKITYNQLQFLVVPLICSFDSSTRLIDLYEEFKTFNKVACAKFIDSGVMPDYEFAGYSNLDSYKTPKMLFPLKELGLID